MSADTADEKIARKLLRDQTARVQLNEPLVVGSIRVTYTELRDDLVAHYQAPECATSRRRTGGSHTSTGRSAVSGRAR